MQIFTSQGYLFTNELLRWKFVGAVGEEPTLEVEQTTPNGVQKMTYTGTEAVYLAQSLEQLRRPPYLTR